MKLALIALAAATLSSPVLAQSREETAMFIMYGYTDVQGVDSRTPGYKSVITMGEDCVLSKKSTDARGEMIEHKVFFNNVDLETLQEQAVYIRGNAQRYIEMKGDGTRDLECDIWYNEYGEPRKKVCQKSIVIFQDTRRNDYHRITKALDFLYGKFCKGYQNKLAF